MLGTYCKGLSIRRELPGSLGRFQLSQKDLRGTTIPQKTTKNVLILNIENEGIKIKKKGTNCDNDHGEKRMTEEADILDVTDSINLL